METEAIVFGEDHVARLTPVTLPPMTDTRVKVETIYGGVSCGTEGDGLSGRAAYLSRPLLTGYQAVGRVIELGENVVDLKLGDLVFVGSMGGGLWDMPNLCGGTHARTSVWERSTVCELSPDIPSLKSASYATLAAVARGGLESMKLRADTVMVVFGLGMLGQMAAKLAQLDGIKVIGVELDERKRNVTEAMHLDAVCEPDPDVIKRALAELGNEQITFALDTTGKPDVVNMAISLLGYHSELTLLAYYPQKVLVDFDVCHGKTMSIHNPVGPQNRQPGILQLIEKGVFNLEPVIKHVIPVDEVTAFYADMVNNRSAYLGVIIDWNS